MIEHFTKKKIENCLKNIFDNYPRENTQGKYFYEWQGAYRASQDHRMMERMVGTHRFRPDTSSCFKLVHWKLLFFISGNSLSQRICNKTYIFQMERNDGRSFRNVSEGGMYLLKRFGIRVFEE